MADMVKMVMSHKNTLERIEVVAIAQEDLFQAAQADSGINDKTIPAVVEEIAVAAAPA
jgi:hypothetical protein